MRGRADHIRRPPTKDTRKQRHDREGWRGGQTQPFGQGEGRRRALFIVARAAGRLGGMGLGHAFESASCFRKAASPASDTSTHFALGEASAS